MATQWFSNMVMDEPSFFHQWQSDASLEQYTEQQIAVAFGQGELEAAALMHQQEQQYEHRPCKAAKLNTTSWDSCITEQGSPADSSSPTILSFGGSNAFAKPAPQPPTAAYYGVKPKQEVDAATAVAPFHKRSYDAMVAAAEPARAAPMTRPAAQNQDHILAERKRREKLSERFIALSKIVPGLKKMDKASVLGDAIKYVKTLQEQVKGMEEVARRRPVESAVLVKKSQLTADEDDGSSCDENFEGAEAGLPEIEARMSDRTVLVKIHCENRKGALIAALTEVESIGLAIMNTNVLPFTTSTLDITIMATASDDFSLSVKDIVRKLNQAFKSSR
ncbi:transcription factor bHLH18-like [Lolium rigidum]|uniref:transcription factor bHLH18-like n=1 Tax=Lolium rigidum TaxID=89674 RepID=UPI001F5C2FDF|nr:transcription factor bHLH18-like [Lolium rigidum]XP_047088492.1 transcription factor bHLH18-like [Lolium rigidum]